MMAIGNKGYKIYLKQNNGFTFVELLIAMGLISATILWFFQMTVTVINTNMYTKRWTIATMYAEQLIEDAYGTNTVGTNSSFTYTNDGILYTGSRTVSYGNGMEVSDFFQVDVSVSWSGQRGDTKSVEIATFHVFDP